MGIIDELFGDDNRRIKPRPRSLKSYLPIKSFYAAALEEELRKTGVKHRICSVSNGYVTLISVIIGETKDEENIQVDMLYFTNAKYVKKGIEEELVFVTMASLLSDEEKHILNKIRMELEYLNIEQV